MLRGFVLCCAVLCYDVMVALCCVVVWGGAICGVESYRVLFVFVCCFVYCAVLCCVVLCYVMMCGTV